MPTCLRNRVVALVLLRSVTLTARCVNQLITSAVVPAILDPVLRNSRSREQKKRIFEKVEKMQSFMEEMKEGGKPIEFWVEEKRKNRNRGRERI